jgi:multidrug efflux pump subunit AcrA (membrane-fusion protein)
MTGRTKLIAAGVAGFVALAAAGGLYLRFGRPVPVPIAEAAPGRVAVQVVGPGTVQARVPVTLSARITATVAQVNADVGDTVKRGQLLALLDDRDLAARRGVVGGQQLALTRNIEAARAAVAKAEAELALARSRQRRDAELLRTGFVSQAVVDASDAALQAAQAGLDNARAAQAAREADAQALSHEARYSEAMLSYARIAAPMDGIVISRLVEPGTTVVPGAALLRLVDPASLWVAMRVDESVIGRVQVGQRASIRLRTGEAAAGKVARIMRQSDAATRELEVDVAFDTMPARLAIDQEAEVSVSTGDAAGIVVPLAALTRDRDGRQGVLVIDDGRARFRAVQTGSADAQRVLVVKGLAAGERVVALASGVKAGARVQAIAATGR